MARTGESSLVVEAPGFGRVADAVKRGVLKLTTPLFGTPEKPTALGRAMDFVDDAAQVGLMSYGASAARLADPRLMRRALGRNPGMEAHRLRRRTGYSRGLFGMGVETHGDASFKPSALFRQGPVEGRLSDLAYVHRDVSTAYPGMESVRVKVVPDSEWAAHVEAAKASVARVSAYTPGASASGFTVHGGDMAGIYVRGWKPGEPMDVWFSRADSTLVHEMQHVAQEADGVRAPYAHLTREDYLRDAREVDARNTAYRRLLTGDERGMILRGATQDTAPELVNLDDKGGDNYGTFRNFLASDDVPDSLFGIPIVQDETRYSASDIEFFRKNPKAAGFYDMGDEEEVGSQEAWGGANTVERVSHDAPRRKPPSAPREHPTMQAAPVRKAELRPGGRHAAPFTEEEFWSSVPGVNSVMPEMRAWARAEENLLPEERAVLERIRLRDMAVETALAMGVPVKTPANLPVLREGFRTGKYLSVPSLRVSEADVATAARHFGKAPSQIMPSDYAAWVNYELNGRQPFTYSRNVLGDASDVAVMNQPQEMAARLARMKGSASVDAFRAAGVKQVSALPRIRPAGDAAAPVLSPVEYQAWKDLRVLPVSSVYGHSYESGAMVPFRASTHVDALTPFRRLPGSSRDYLEVLSEYDGLPLATKAAVHKGLPHQHFIDLHADPSAEVQAVRFGWQDRLNDPNVFLGGRRIDPGTVFGGRLKRGAEDDKGGSTRSGTVAGVPARSAAELSRLFKDHVKAYEMRRPDPYKDVDGNWAVGYGSHFLADGTPVTKDTKVSGKDIDDAFDVDLTRRIGLLSGRDRRQARYAIPNWRFMSPESRLMLLDVSWGRKDTLTKRRSKGLFEELEAAGGDRAALDDAVRRHYLSYRFARDAQGNVDPDKTAGLQKRRIALFKALTGEDFSYDGKKWNKKTNRFEEMK